MSARNAVYDIRKIVGLRDFSYQIRIHTEDSFHKHETFGNTLQKQRW